MTIQIINITHKKCFLPKSQNIITIHAGRKIAKEKSKDGYISESVFQWLKKNTLGDDTGENISDLNRYYNEMTAIYWAWKNYKKIGNPTAIGFMHYRRHFILKDKVKISGNYTDDLGLTPELLEKLTKKYDLIHPKFMKMKHGKFIEKIGKGYCDLGGEKIKKAIQMALEIIKEKHPEDFPIFKKVFESQETGSFCNMFIMKKELFFEYCQWIFPILFELDKRLGRDYKAGQERCVGWTAEMLTSIFIYLKAKKVAHKEVFVYNQNPFEIHNKLDILVIRLKMLFGKKTKLKKYKDILYNYRLRKKYKKTRGDLK